MQLNSVFDQLVHELSEGERVDMLNKLTGLIESESEPVHIPEDDPVTVNLETEYSGFSIFQKIIIFIKTIFTQTTRLQVIEDTVMRRIFNSLEEQYPGIYDFTSATVRPAFLVELKKLKQSLKVFSEVIVNVSIDQKEEIFAFILNRELPEIDSRIRQLSDIERNFSLAKHESPSEKELNRQMVARFEDILMEMTPEERLLLSRDAQFFQILHELTFFPFDKVIARFSSNNETSCAASEIKEHLQQLTRIFMSMTFMPSPGLVEALFIINRLEREVLDTGDLLEKIKSDMTLTREALRTLRLFNRGIPLFDLSRLASGKANVFLKPVSAGEDWSALVRSYWKKRLRAEVKRFLVAREYRVLETDAAGLLGQEKLKNLPYYRQDIHTVPLSLTHVSSLSFLHGFAANLFNGRLNPVLKQVLIDGEFYKAQNSEDFSESYNGLNLLQEKLRLASDYLSPRGEGGQLLVSLENDLTPSLVRKKKIEAVAAEADSIALKHLTTGIEQLRLLASVVNGILHGEKGGRFDSLSNIGYMGGRNNETFMKELNSASITLNEGAKVLSDMVRLEERSAGFA